jgi:outer membrane receptor for ferrienterochelin and colicin
VAAAKQFTFTPAELDFKPAAVQLTYAYQFVFRAPAEPDAGPASESAPAPREGPVNLSGTVLERGTRRPLVGAQVAIPALQQESVADADGHFAFRDVPLGPVALVVNQPGYSRFETTETIEAGKETRAIYYVQKAYFSQFQTVVRGRKDRKEVSQQTISVEETQKVPGTQGDTLKVVQNLPGVARSSFGLGALVIRGTSANDSGVFLDGVEIPLLYHFGGLTSVYNSDLLESIAYLPGNYSTYYGDLIGGVVDVKSRSPRKDRWGGYANISLLEASLVLEGPVTDDISVSISGRRSYIDATLKAAPASTQSMFSVAPRYYDAQAKVEWRINNRHTLTLLGITSDDNLELLFDRPSDTDPTVAGKFHLETGFSQLRLKHQYRNGNWRVDTIGVLGRINLLITPGTVQIFQLTSNEYNLRSNVEYEFAPSFTLAAGVDEVYDRASITANVARPAEEGEPVQPGGKLISVKAPFYQYFPSLYAEGRWKPLDGLLVIPGLRTESYVFTDQSKADRSVSPRLGIRYDLNSEWAFKGGAGIYHGTATQAEPTKAFGNPDIRSKESDQFSLGAE